MRQIITHFFLLMTITYLVFGFYVFARASKKDALLNTKASNNTNFVKMWPVNNDSPVCDTHNLWSQETFVEIDYFKDILNPIGLKIQQHRPDTLPNTIEILGYSVNHYTAKEVQNIVDTFNPKILINFSDEWGTYPEHNTITGVDLILRQYFWEHYPQQPHIHQVAIGYHCWDKYILPSVPIDQRRYVFSFIGSPKGKRHAQLDELKREFDPKDYFADKIQPSANKQIYSQSKFVFCPRGNNAYETYRHYQAMRNGCIPIVVIDEKTFRTQFGNLTGGGPPIIRAPTIAPLIAEMKRLLGEKEEMIELSRKQVMWYDSHIKAIQNEFTSVLRKL
eukprot:gene430-792_t